MRLRHTANRVAIALLLTFVVAAFPRRAGADAPPLIRPPAPAADEAPEEPEVDPASPRAAVESYLELVRDGKHGDAAEYLQLPEEDKERGAELAEQLWFVLERNGGADVEALSSSENGDEDDGLKGAVDRVATIQRPSGKEEDLLIKRVETKRGPRWLFARDSVRKVDVWYDDLGERRFVEKLPEPLRRGAPLGLLWWQVGGFLLVVFVGWIAGVILGKVTTRVAKVVLKRRSRLFAVDLVGRFERPIVLLWGVTICWLLLPLLDLFPTANETVRSVLRLTAYVALFWAFAVAADVYAVNATKSEWAARNPASKNIIPLASRLLKVIVIGGATVGLLAKLGFPVGSLIAGIGIGGLALALAGQRTIENLFGAVSIAIDQPLREGDLVKIGEQIGTVESIGLRSTRIRSLHRTVIAFPNSTLAKMEIESLAARDRMRFECNIALAYTTRAAQIRRLLGDVRGILEGHAAILTESVDVHLAGYAESSLDIEVSAFVLTTDVSKFLDIRQELLLSFMQAVEEAGTTFALPTTTVHVAEADGAGDLLAGRPAESISASREH